MNNDISSKVNSFNNINQLEEYLTNLVKNKHQNDFVCIFLGGSFVRNTQTSLSDIDYTTVVSDKFSHSKFYFELIELEEQLRLLSNFYFEKCEVLPDKTGDEEYLWIKRMLPETRFVSGDKRFYDDICNFYEKLEYTRPPKFKTIHKSYGKLLELIARIKKWRKNNNFVEMVYYGSKLAEHVRRLVLEINGPIALRSENFFLEGHFSLPLLPEKFEELYLEINRYTAESITLDEYERCCIELVLNTSKFLTTHKDKIDPDTITLLESPVLRDFIELK